MNSFNRHARLPRLLLRVFRSKSQGQSASKRGFGRPRENSALGIDSSLHTRRDPLRTADTTALGIFMLASSVKIQ